MNKRWLVLLIPIGAVAFILVFFTEKENTNSTKFNFYQAVKDDPRSPGWRPWKKNGFDAKPENRVNETPRDSGVDW